MTIEPATAAKPTEAKRIFLEAVELGTRDARSQFLDQACADDAALRQRVENLLQAHDQSNSLLDGSGLLATVAPTTLEGAGTQIGPYKLLQQIGEGGMGVVYMAEQKEPVERRVALKIIKPGMDSRQVIARFEAERQALALMDHPNIARVLDAGTTDSGRPYFVMELVKGVPITKYCDEKHLSLKERLELMIPVCQAIQHAHQKGIIHRDIKPTNVLVAQYDGKPVPKVIDFGVAKATAQKLTERTMFTELGQIVGTLEYMSPEQAELNQLDIDTRSDIYSLGVLLYELLTGSTPFDKQKLRSAAFHEMLRIIREDEPPKPSTNLSTSGALPSIAANRQTEPARLSKAVRGELDWIVMKALEKDRTRRYETANGFAADIQRYLSDEPVQACPPSAGYRFGKFARRNKATLTTTAIVAASLIIGTVVSVWQAIDANNARKLADERLVLADERLASEQQARRTAEEEHQRAETNFHKAVEAVDRLISRIGYAELGAVPNARELQIKFLNDALNFLEGFLAERPHDFELRAEAADTFVRMFHSIKWRWPDGQKVIFRAQQLLTELHAERPDDLGVRRNLAMTYMDREFPDKKEREASIRHGIGLMKPIVEDPQTDIKFIPKYRLGLAHFYAMQGNYLKDDHRDDEAQLAYRKAIALCREGWGVDTAHFEQAYDFKQWGPLPEEESEALLTKCYKSFVNALDLTGRLSEAIEVEQEAIAFKETHREIGDSQINSISIAILCVTCGDMLLRSNRMEDARVYFQKALENDPGNASAQKQLARIKSKQADSQKKEP